MIETIKTLYVIITTLSFIVCFSDSEIILSKQANVDFSSWKMLAMSKSDLLIYSNYLLLGYT